MIRKKIKKGRTKKGFTLIELLIIIALVGILASVILILLNPQDKFASARDANRIHTVSALAKVMSDYHISDKISYPNSSPTWQTSNLLATGELTHILAVTPAVQCNPANSEGNRGDICYSSSPGGKDAVIWTGIESYSYISRAKCVSGQSAAFAWIASLESVGLICLQSPASIPTPDAVNNLYDTLSFIPLNQSGNTNQIPTPSPAATISPTNTPTPTPTGSPGSSLLPFIAGSQIKDENSKTLILRGAMIDTSFAYINQYITQKKDPLQYLNTPTFQAMRTWNMNAVRINISQWIMQQDQTNYLSKLDSVIAQATGQGLYVVLDFHDDNQSGSPYSDGMLHPESIPWWVMVAKRYQTNTHIMFDPINEPKYSDWNSWLHGGTNSQGQQVMGFADVISAFRSNGIKQIIVIEPGNAGKISNPVEGGWSGFDPNLITDPNIIYSKHDYANVVTGNPAFWDGEWGSVLNNHPIYYGEWAVLPYPQYPIFCSGPPKLRDTNADTITLAFLTYLKSRGASWTAWDFKTYHLLSSYAPNFSPTTFDIGVSWQCMDPLIQNGGMGTVVQQFLLNNP